MAEQQDEKSRLPLAGILAVVAIISSFLIYEGISLRTSRPIDKEAASKVFLEEGLVQARLWQDPFEAVETHRLQEAKQPKNPGLRDDPHTLDNLIKVIEESGVSSGLRILPVFVDGSPYVSSVESRIRRTHPPIQLGSGKIAGDRCGFPVDPSRAVHPEGKTSEYGSRQTRFGRMAQRPGFRAAG
jgi:hypothetical protein